jgi:addiction module RelE/StbE family toxin
MIYKINWTHKALQQLNNHVRYLEKHWTLKEINNFLNAVKEHETMLSHQPEMFPLSSRHEGYRKCIITKYIVIYYEIRGDQVLIQAFWDSRRNPNDLTL